MNSPPVDAGGRRFGAALAALAVAAFALRIHGIDLTAYNLDEAALSQHANAIANLKAFPLFGVRTSFGFHNPPLLAWLLAPFFIPTAMPHFAMAGLAAAGSAAAALAGAAGRRLWGCRAGLVAAALVAFAPNAIDHCRRLWGHDTIVLWTALCLYATVRGVQEGRSRWLAGAFASAAAAQACHLSGALLWIAPATALAMLRPPRWGRTAAAGAAVLLLVYLPWFIGDSGQGFEELRMIGRTAVGAAEPTGRPTPVAPPLAWSTVLADSLHNDHLGMDYPAFLRRSALHYAVAVAWRVAAAGLLLAAAVALAGRAFKKGDGDFASRALAAAILALLLAPLVAFTLLPVEAVPPYQLPALVPAALGAGLAFSRLPQRVGRASAVAAVAAAAACGAGWSLSAANWLGAIDGTSRSSSLLRYKEDAVAWIAGAAAGEPYAIMQDARPPEYVDRWMLYVHWYVTGDPSVPNDPEAPRVFLVRDLSKEMPGALAAWLDGRPRAEFGALAVYDVEGAEAARWRAMASAR